MDKGFAQRLNLACDSHPHAPPYGRGRQSWLKEQVGVSHEAVRKWFTGDSRPKPMKMRELSKVLEVDEAWLSLGIQPDLYPAEKRARNAIAEGATNMFMGLVQINGGHVAFPDAKDPRAAFVDFYAIIRGVQTPFHISLAQKLTPGSFKLNIPLEFDQCMVVGAFHQGPMEIEYIHMPLDDLDKHKIRQGGYCELMVNQTSSNYITGDTVWKKVTGFRNMG